MVASTYQEAAVAVRDDIAAIDAELARKLAKALRAYADTLTRSLANLPMDVGHAQAVSAAAAREAAATLERAAVRMTLTGQEQAASVVVEAYQAAIRTVSRALHLDVTDLLPTTKIPDPSVMLQGLASGRRSPWRTTLAESSGQARVEIQQLVGLALAGGMDREELAKRIRAYVTGADQLAAYFRESPTGPRLDLRYIPADLRGAAQRVVSTARRIAYSEVGNAQAEATVAWFRADPFVVGVRWALDRDRGKQQLPDVCDVLAGVNFYGIGTGVYPTDQVPPVPHPVCRCGREAVLQDQPRDEKKWAGRLRRDLNRVPIPRAELLTDHAAVRIRTQAATLLGLARTHGGP